VAGGNPALAEATVICLDSRVATLFDSLRRLTGMVPVPDAVAALAKAGAATGLLSQPGLYLFFEEGTSIVLTEERIQSLAQAMWEDPNGIPREARAAADFQRCDICPLKGRGGICDALRPSIPFLKEIDRYASFDRVVAVYREHTQDVLHVSATSMQTALEYVSMLSLMYFCQNGRRYWKYFRGITPLTEFQETAIRLYLNIYWLHRGDAEAVNRVIDAFHREILETTRNQIKRMTLICRNDAFLNAFVRTQSATQLLALDMPKRMERAFQAFSQA
jgi:hypothetical protein